MGVLILLAIFFFVGKSIYEQLGARKPVARLREAYDLTASPTVHDESYRRRAVRETLPLSIFMGLIIFMEAQEFRSVLPILLTLPLLLIIFWVAFKLVIFRYRKEWRADGEPHPVSEDEVAAQVSNLDTDLAHYLDKWEKEK